MDQEIENQDCFFFFHRYSVICNTFYFTYLPSDMETRFFFIYLGTTGIQTGQNPKEYPQNFMLHNKKKLKIKVE